MEHAWRFRGREDTKGPGARSIEQTRREECLTEELRFFVRGVAASMERASRFVGRVASGAVAGLLAKLVECTRFPSIRGSI